LKEPDGGPAFPRDDYYDEKRYGQTDGMSLRDYFAGQALVGYANHLNGKVGDSWPSTADFARWAYEQADAMLKAREQS
jgi:hypothetical protein